MGKLADPDKVGQTVARRTEAIRLGSEVMDKVRKLAKQLGIPMSMLIEKILEHYFIAMEAKENAEKQSSEGQSNR